MFCIFYIAILNEVHAECFGTSLKDFSVRIIHLLGDVCIYAHHSIVCRTSFVMNDNPVFSIVNSFLWLKQDSVWRERPPLNKKFGYYEMVG